MQILLGVLAGLAVLVVLVTIHELGHALAALKNGVVVEEFAIGFPPTIWSKKLKNGVDFKINILPLGGYVKLQGEHDAASEKGDYGAASFWAKTQILFAGVFFNFVFACVLMTILAWIGLPQVLSNQFRLANDGRIERSAVRAGLVTPDGSADRAGLKKDDQILKIDGKTIDSPEMMRTLTKELAGREVTVEYRRTSGKQTVAQVQVKISDHETAKQKGYIGMIPVQDAKIYAGWSAPIVGVGTVVQMMGETLKGVGQLFANFFGGLVQKLSFDQATRQQADQKIAQAGQAVAGPVGLLGVIFPALIGGELTTFVLFVAIISLTLAVMNALPIPALDGGRWVVTAIFRGLKKPLSKELEEQIHGTGMMVLLALTLLITISDVFKFFK